MEGNYGGKIGISVNNYLKKGILSVVEKNSFGIPELVFLVLVLICLTDLMFFFDSYSIRFPKLLQYTLCFVIEKIDFAL